MTDPMAGIAPWGLIETRYRAWIKELGELSPRQLAIAEQVYRIAHLLDDEEAGSQAAALSRELRIAITDFQDVKAPATDGNAAATSHPDEVANKRAERRGEKPPGQKGTA